MQTDNTPQMILASASPRRKRILAEMGYAFAVDVPAVDEISDAADPVGTVAFNAGEKWRAARVRHPAACVIAADTLVSCDGGLLGKPADEREAEAFLQALSGRVQTVYTALALGLPEAVQPDLRIAVSSVRFKPLDSAVIRRYIALVQPYDRAGGYDISEHGDLLVESFTGSYTNIVGLPGETLSDWLLAHGIFPAADAP